MPNRDTTPPHGQRITTRLDGVLARGDETVKAAIETMRRERMESDERRKIESDHGHRVAQVRYNNLEEHQAAGFKELKDAVHEIKLTLNQILMQALKTNGRVDSLEKESTKNAVDVESLKTDRTRALQTLFVLGLIIWGAWLFMADDLKTRGVINRSPDELSRIIEADFNRRGILPKKP